MARYFFDHSDGVLTADLEGAELLDLTAARQMAFDAFCEMMSGRSATFWKDDEWEVQCRDERGLRLFTLTLMANDAPCVRSR